MSYNKLYDFVVFISNNAATLTNFGCFVVNFAKKKSFLTISDPFHPYLDESHMQAAIGKETKLQFSFTKSSSNLCSFVSSMSIHFVGRSLFRGERERGDRRQEHKRLFMYML